MAATRWVDEYRREEDPDTTACSWKWLQHNKRREEREKHKHVVQNNLCTHLTENTEIIVA